MSTMQKPKKAKALTSDKDQWMNIAAIVIFIGCLIISFGIGMRFGKQKGEKQAIALISKELHDHMDKNCLDKLAHTFQENQ